MKCKKVRIDQLLVDRNLAEDLKKARALIMAAKVVVNEQRIDKVAQLVNVQSNVRIKGQKAYVSRGGEKLASAINYFELKQEFKDKTILDVGSSTGGFTDCALKHGAARVIALDVGANQLDWSLRAHSKVTSLENTDIREFDGSVHPDFDWVLADISFNKIGRLAPYIAQAGSLQTRFLLLVKPQFEIISSKVPKGGVIDSAHLRQEACDLAVLALEESGLKLLGSYNSQIKGRSGNQEIFILLEKQPQDHA